MLAKLWPLEEFEEEGELVADVGSKPWLVLLVADVGSKLWLVLELALEDSLCDDEEVSCVGGPVGGVVCPPPLGVSALARVIENACTTGTVHTAAAPTTAPRCSIARRLSTLFGSSSIFTPFSDDSAGGALHKVSDSIGARGPTANIPCETVLSRSPNMASVLRLPVPAPGIVMEEMDGELCLLRVATDEVLILNQSASDIWILCTAGLETGALITQLASAHGVAAIDLSEQVSAALAELESRGFLVEGQSDDA